MLANISGTYSVKAIQTKIKNGKHDLDCKGSLYCLNMMLYTAISIKVVPKQSAKAEKSNKSARGMLGIAKKLTNFLVIKK
jgi:hypothetical protein